jgi:DNA invertase Pin-like site-specific DNA recombinase
MARTAVAYVSDVILGTTGDVIGRDAQRRAIRRHAEENEIELVGWFEDEAYNADVLSRGGFRQLLARARAGDIVLVERVWSLSRSWKALEPLLEELSRRGLRLEAATLLWDCTSQRARHYEAERRKSRAPATEVAVVPATAAAVPVRKPDRLFFTDLIHRHA